VGNILGGFSFLSILVILYSSFAASISSHVSGPKRGLDILPASILSTILSVMVFYSLELALGEFLRRNMMSTILAGMIFFTSFIAETYINIVFDHKQRPITT
jgi:ABC-type transport system involved in multi-copper enzyme maturation permease subunit